jgi:hypothetical protein
MVKAHIANMLGLGDDPEFKLSKLLADQVSDYNLDAATDYAKRVFDDYMKGPFQRLWEEERGISSIFLDKKTDLVVGEDRVPVYIRPDGHTNIGKILDWKINGSTSSYTTSPCQGYKSAISVDHRGRLTDKGPHKKYGQPLEDLKMDWARQLAIYSWGHGSMLPWRDIPVRIEQVVCNSGPKFTFVSIDTYISKNFQRNLWSRLSDAWNRITEGNIALPTPNNHTCNAYGSVCEVHDKCEAYNRWQNPEDDELAGLKS